MPGPDIFPGISSHDKEDPVRREASLQFVKRVETVSALTVSYLERRDRDLWLISRCQTEHRKSMISTRWNGIGLMRSVECREEIKEVQGKEVCNFRRNI